MKIAKTKERILQYLENKGISKTIFFEKTGIKRGFLDKDKLNQAVSDEHFAKIIAVFPELNIYWLILGEGEMLKSKKQEPINNTEGISQDERISKLLNIIEKQQDTINNQQEIINNLVNKQEKTSVQQDNDAECATA